MGAMASLITSLTIYSWFTQSFIQTQIKKKTSKLRVIGLCVGNSPGTGEFPAQMASNAENVSIWWRHHVCASVNDGSAKLHSKSAPNNTKSVLNGFNYLSMF